MRASAALSIVLGVAVIAGLVGCATLPPASAERILASEDVVRELHETRPAFTELAVADQAIVYLWLHANCAAGMDEERARFTRAGARLEAALIEAFKMGPPSAFLGELSATRRADYAAIADQLRSSEEPFVEANLQKRVLALTEQTYLTDGLERTVANYRLAALEGLSVVGSPIATAWLERTAGTLEDAELRPAAERSLAALRSRLRR
jgi:hypothetical protein